jgi:hypothetical protein
MIHYRKLEGLGKSPIHTNDQYNQLYQCMIQIKKGVTPTERGINSVSMATLMFIKILCNLVAYGLATHCRKKRVEYRRKIQAKYVINHRCLRKMAKGI